MKIFALLAVLVLCGCGETLVVESDTSWHGTFGPPGGGEQVSRTGNAEFRPPRSGEMCWTFQKNTETGVLRAYLRDRTFPNIVAAKHGFQETTAPLGQVTGCR